MIVINNDDFKITHFILRRFLLIKLLTPIKSLETISITKQKYTMNQFQYSDYTRQVEKQTKVL